MSGQFQGNLTRSLEKILEEAHLSGELKLSGRKLKEFPRTGRKYNLSDTVIADLSKNRFSELPIDVTKFWSLERLNCYHNVIRSVPESVVFLQSLVYVNLSRNYFSTLPVALCQLPLEILSIANNKITVLPEELGRCKTLMELDISCNQITHLPPQLGQLSLLRVLNVRNNLLLELPIELTYLKLIYLDLSENRIATLPVELRTMTSLVSLELSHNPLVSPPASVCIRGRIHVFKYLELRSAKEDKARYGSGWRGNGIEDKRVGRKLSDIRAKQRHERERQCNGGASTPSTLSPGDSSINNSEEGLNEICKKRLERSSSEREVSKQSSSESGIKSLSSTSLGSKYGKPGGTLNGVSSLTSMSEQVTSSMEFPRPHHHVQSYREYKEALRLQRTQDVYRPRQSSDESTPSPVPNNNLINDYDKTPSPHLASSEGSPIMTNNSEVKRPVQKVIPSRNNNFTSTTPPPSPENNSVNGCNNIYIKPVGPQLVTTTVGYVGTGVPPSPRPMTWNRNVPPDKLSFTMRREFEKAKEEAELIQQLKTNIETRLKMSLPADLSPALSDGVVLCHLANHVRPRSVASIHVPSPAVPKLTMARCRRNVDNFLEACRRIGVEENLVCCAGDVLEGRGLVQVAITVGELLRFHQPRSPAHISHP
uniref:Calponin-homology (CH) domain-containing protein n=1 Tax=Clastoptera arizonana TaxID=38151 RepID=A0A1B6BZY8_9HEMI